MAEQQIGAVAYWNQKHQRYAKTDWIAKPSLFAQFAAGYFPRRGQILDLGAGQGQDTRYFAQRGYNVTAVDFSDVAIKIAKEKLPQNAEQRVQIIKHDLRDPLPLADHEFDAVYASLSLHYFDTATTIKIFNEIYRVLKLGGIFACMLNSVHDPEYRSGPAIEPDYFLIGKFKKRYFSSATLLPFIANYKQLVLDENGHAYAERDVTKNNRFVRFIGKK